MRKIRLTEKQLEECKAQLNEEGEITVSYKPTNGVTSVDDMKNQLKQAQKNAPGAKISLDVNSSDLNLSEMKCYTKGYLKESNLKRLGNK